MVAVGLGGALHGFEEVALKASRYDSIQAQIAVYDSVGMDADSLSRVNVLLADYLSGKTDDLSIEEEVFGIRQQVFNKDEKLHMVDVKNLFSLAHTIKLTALIGGALLLLAVGLSAGREYKQVFEAGIKWEVISLAVLLAVGYGAVMMVGFDKLFIGFHHVFFTNDLWLMNPAEDIMIRMFPSAFFERITSLIGGCMFRQWIDLSLIVDIPIFAAAAAAEKFRAFSANHRRK